MLDDLRAPRRAFFFFFGGSSAGGARARALLCQRRLQLRDLAGFLLFALLVGDGGAQARQLLLLLLGLDLLPQRFQLGWRFGPLSPVMRTAHVLRDVLREYSDAVASFTELVRRLASR